MFLLVLIALPPATRAAEGPLVLQLTPEDLRPYASKRELRLADRDPFNWPPEQLARLQTAARTDTPDFLSGLSLSGIIWDEKMPLAVINERMLGVGDMVAGATITAIFKETVVLEHNGAPHTLWFQKGRGFKLPSGPKVR
jgi:hypothetical protein